MSGSEGNQNNQMSAQDIEEEEMAQELMGMAMYEEGMNYETMKQILQVINESRDMAGIQPETHSSQESAGYSPEMVATEVVVKNNSMQEPIYKEKSLRRIKPKPSFSYRTQSERVSPPTSDCKSTVESKPAEERSVSSPELFETSEPKRASVEGNSIFDQLVKENEQVTEEMSRTRPQAAVKNTWHTMSDSSESSQSVEPNILEAKSKKNQRFERWKLDPTKAVVQENDVPLQQRIRPMLHERIPYSFCHHEKALEVSEKVMTVLAHHLEEVAEMWKRKHRSYTSEFQWGSPIKVGANNGSLDRQPVTEAAGSPQRHESVMQYKSSFGRRCQDRQCKRKADIHIKDIMLDQPDSDEDSDSIFDNTKKAKTTDKAWQPRTRKNLSSAEKIVTRQEKIFSNLHTTNAEATAILNSDSDVDNDDLSTLHIKNQRKKVVMVSESSPEVFYPRRVIPPNPNKRKGIQYSRKNEQGKSKKKSPAKKNTQAVLEKNEGVSVTGIAVRGRKLLRKHTNSQATVVVNEDEITVELTSDVESSEIQVDIEIKPKPIKALAVRLQQSTTKLIEHKNSEDNAERTKILEQHKLECEAKKQMEDLAMARYLKEQAEFKQKAMQDKEEKDKEEKWRKNEATRERQRRKRQEEEKRSSGDARKQIFILTDANEDGITGAIQASQERNNEKQVECPICLQEFAQKDIQSHAAECEQFGSIDKPHTSNSQGSNDDLIIESDPNSLLCNVCFHFSTSNGIAYEDHIHNCLKRKRERMNSQTQLDSSGTCVIEVPTSPIKCFEPISEQIGSAINYAEQFKAQLTEQKGKPMLRTRKRKR